jgi:hypothetical protein
METNYNYNFKIGSFIQRNRRIDVISANDLNILETNSAGANFEPIFISDYVLQAYGFKKSSRRVGGAFFYTRNCIIVRLRPFVSHKYYCTNIPFPKDFIYLHELQNFYELFDPFQFYKTTYFVEFVASYGSRYLGIYDC